MIHCSQCRNQEMVGVLFCTECGAPIREGNEVLAPIPANLGGETSFATRNPHLHSGEPFPSSLPRLSLHLIDYNEVVPVADRKETTLGRVSPGQPVTPDLDLSPYQAYEAGVSRLHASLRLNEGEVMILDLGSSNGTRLNGQKITPHLPQSIHHGDMITLGKFRIQIYLGPAGK